MKLLWTLISGAALISGCTSTKIVPTEKEVIHAPEVVRVWGRVLVDKKEKWNVRTVVQNLSNDQSILFFLSQMRCYRGERQGYLEHAFAGIGERKINIMPGGQKEFNFLCVFQQEQTSGDFKIVIPRVFSNPAGDGATPGKTLATDLEWVIKDRPHD